MLLKSATGGLHTKQGYQNVTLHPVLILHWFHFFGPSIAAVEMLGMMRNGGVSVVLPLSWHWM